MKFNITTITLVFIAVLIFLYLVSQKDLSIHNSGSLNNDQYTEADSYDGSSYDETEVSSAETSRMVGKNSASGGKYAHSSYYNGTRGGNSETGLDMYFDAITTPDADSEVTGIDSSISPPASKAANGDFQGGNDRGNEFATYTSTGNTSEDMFNAGELLPQSGTNSYFDTYDNIKVGNSQLINVYRPIGTNTVMGSLRNPTFDLRGEPANQKRNVGPWMNSTIQPNVYKTGICSN
jgi:hypothetical protein